MDARRLQLLINEFRDRVADRAKEECRSNPFANLDDRQALTSTKFREEIAERDLLYFVETQVMQAAAPEVRGFSMHKAED